MFDHFDHSEIMGSEEMWPYLLAVSGIPAILQFVTLLFFPEAPRHLYIDKGDTEGCKKGRYWEHGLKQIFFFLDLNLQFSLQPYGGCGRRTT